MGSQTYFRACYRQKVYTQCVPSLSEVEFCSLVSKKRRLGELSLPRAKKILDLFATHVAEGFYRRMVLTAEHYLKARQLIASMDIKLHTLDALHLSAAAAENLTLVTADRDLAAAARRHKRPVEFLQ